MEHAILDRIITTYVSPKKNYINDYVRADIIFFDPLLM